MNILFNFCNPSIAVAKYIQFPSLYSSTDFPLSTPLQIPLSLYSSTDFPLSTLLQISLSLLFYRFPSLYSSTDSPLSTLLQIDYHAA